VGTAPTSLTTPREVITNNHPERNNDPVTPLFEVEKFSNVGIPTNIKPEI